MARRAILEVSPIMLVELLRGHPMSEMTSDCPADLKIIGVRQVDAALVDPPINFIVESADFDDIPEGAFLPNWRPIFTVRRSELAAILDLVRPDS